MIEWIKNFFRPSCFCKQHADFSRIGSSGIQEIYKCNLCGEEYKKPLRWESMVRGHGKYYTHPVLFKYLARESYKKFINYKE